MLNQIFTGLQQPRLSLPELGFRLFLLIAAILIIYSRLLYIHVPFERDEGEYAYMGQLILKGGTLYLDAFNMKFPGTSLMYAFMFCIGGQTVECIRIGTIVAVVLTSWFIFRFTKYWYGTLAGGVSSVTYLALCSTMQGQGILSNCEVFVMLFSVPGIYMAVKGSDRNRGWQLLLAGLLLGIGVLMKQQAFVFSLFVLMLLMARFVLRPRLSAAKNAIMLGLGFAIPIGALLAYVLAHGAWHNFKFITITYAAEYLKILKPAERTWHRNLNFAEAANAVFPLLQVTLFASAALLLPIKIKHRLALFLLLASSWIVVTVGGFFRVHYFILLYFSLALNFGVVVASWAALNRRFKYLVLTVAAGCIGSFFYLQRGSLFPSNPMVIYGRTYNWEGFTLARNAALMANEYLKPGEKLAMLSNEPEVYFYSNRVGVSPYLYIYPFYESQKYAMAMARDYTTGFENAHCNFFLFCTCVPDNPNPETTAYLNDWWRKYSRDFDLSAIYNLTTGNLSTAPPNHSLQVDYATSVPEFQYWVRKQKID